MNLGTQGAYTPRSSRSRKSGESRGTELIALASELQRSLDREMGLRNDLVDLARRHALLSQEREHRTANGLQFIINSLQRQSRVAQAPDVKAQLLAASSRIMAMHQVQRRIHENGQCEFVAFTELLRSICKDLSSLLCPDGDGGVIEFEGEPLEVATAVSVPLALVVNELITNAQKYAAGCVIVRLERDAQGRRHVSVTDDGPGFPSAFEPRESKGLGMKIILALVDQIGGELTIRPGVSGHGACCAVSF